MSDPFSFDPNDEGERLQKLLARLGYGSRRRCEEMISTKRVNVNGQTAILGARVKPGVDAVEVDGLAVGTSPDLVYYLVNKPKGVITTLSDPQGRPKITELVPESPRVFPVGRLDANTEGLIILTNDGELAQILAHPSRGVEKEYLAYVSGRPSESDLSKLRKGVELEDGLTSPAKVALLGPQLLRIVIHEGRNRQVRRMMDAVGHRVIRLVRTRIGPISDMRLAPGTFRTLTPSEVISLRESS